MELVQERYVEKVSFSLNTTHLKVSGEREGQAYTSLIDLKDISDERWDDKNSIFAGILGVLVFMALALPLFEGGHVLLIAIGIVILLVAVRAFTVEFILKDQHHIQLWLYSDESEGGRRYRRIIEFVADKPDVDAVNTFISEIYRRRDLLR